MRLVTRGLFHAGRLSYLMSTILHSCAASTLKLAELRSGIREHWQDFASRESDVAESFYESERTAADRYLQPGMSVLVAGCGSGREVFPLIARGCRVTGVDPATDALAFGRRLLDDRGLTAELVEGFIDEVRVPGRFHSIWLGSCSYSLIPEAARRIRTLRNLASQLEPGGFFFLNFQSPLARPRPIVIRAARAAGSLFGSDWRMEAGDLMGWKQRDGRAYYSYGHAFVLEEIEAEASAAGLRIVSDHSSGDFAAYVLQKA